MYDWFINLDTSNQIEIFSISIGSVTSIIAILISVVILIQNNKMIFESNKPYISIFPKAISFSSPYIHLILKNFGNSGATILNIEYDDILNTYLSRKPFEHMKNVFIAPGQSYVYPLEPNKEPKECVTFKINYKYLNKTYVEHCIVNFNQFNDICYVKVHSSKDIKEISEILQEMTLQKL